VRRAICAGKELNSGLPSRDLRQARIWVLPSPPPWLVPSVRCLRRGCVAAPRLAFVSTSPRAHARG
jgi:hypothetical protein